jgi:malonyl-CoA O-methyltransferase
MTDDASGRSTARRVDRVALARIARRRAAAPAAPWLHEEVARRMGERLALIRSKPGRIIDWGACAGGSTAVLRRAYPGAVCQAVEPGGPCRSLRWWQPRRWLGRGSGALPPEEVVPGDADLVWANMALHAAADPLAVIRAWHRALAVDGFLMFSTLGPGTLPQLRALYDAEGWGPPMAPLVDMHDLGDMLVEAGFADPVMDQEMLILNWRDAAAALAELRELGANADPGRMAGLRTPRWGARLRAGLTRHAGRPDGRIELGFELVYGHAFKPPPRAAAARESAIALEDLRALARTPRRRPQGGAVGGQGSSAL